MTRDPEPAEARENLVGRKPTALMVSEFYVLGSVVWWAILFGLALLVVGTVAGCCGVAMTPLVAALNGYAFWTVHRRPEKVRAALGATLLVGASAGLVAALLVIAFTAVETSSHSGAWANLGITVIGWGIALVIGCVALPAFPLGIYVLRSERVTRWYILSSKGSDTQPYRPSGG